MQIAVLYGSNDLASSTDKKSIVHNPQSICPDRQVIKLRKLLLQHF